ncbi:MAG TPA: GNAT family N-acetyltransferase [Acidimicrobiales bacterium]
MSDEPQVIDNPARSRFEVEIDEHLAQLIYERHGDTLVLIHTEVPEELGGRGLGGRLVTAAVDTAQANGLTIVARCPYAKHWLETHPDVAGRVHVTMA